MGHTRVIYSDATTAEATSVLKSCGFLESNQGGLFTSPSMPVRVFVVWGKSLYYPELSARLDFTPRIQIHVKSRELCPDIEQVTVGAVSGLRAASPGTRIRVFDAGTMVEIAS